MDWTLMDGIAFQSWKASSCCKFPPSCSQLLEAARRAVNLDLDLESVGGNAFSDTRYEIWKSEVAPPQIYGDIFTRYKWTRPRMSEVCPLYRSQEKKKWPQITHQTCRHPFILVWIRGVTIPLFTWSKSGFGISKRVKIWLWIRIKCRNHDTSIGVTILLSLDPNTDPETPKSWKPDSGSGSRVGIITYLQGDTSPWFLYSVDIKTKVPPAGGPLL